ncbi:hypothetical protein FACS1894199_06510 [Bacteroidia bacterium]|nr:hypothetical protein FACS1894199_06510 [Bacteroidia bacterium]
MKNFGFFICMILLVGCAEMNDKHDEFLARGETVYIGKVDSVLAFPGDGKLLLRYWISDPRAKNVTVYWGFNDANSKVLTVAQHTPEEALEVILSTADGLTEGNATFHWVTSDLHGNKSMVFESLASIYGSLYSEDLISRRIIGAILANNGDIVITLATSSSSEEIGIELFYTRTNGTETAEYYPQLGTSLTLSNVDYTKEIRYRTLFKPTPTAIDSFATEPQKITVRKVLSNIVLNKPTTTSSVYLNDPTYAGDKFVDGNPTSTQWFQAADGTVHWIEIDLQGTFTIGAIQIWKNVTSNTSQLIPRFNFQVDVNGEWVTVVSETNGPVTPYYKDFNAISTGKVRLYIPAYTNNWARLREIEVYEVIEY